jgi:hypothetical protein
MSNQRSAHARLAQMQLKEASVAMAKHKRRVTDKRQNHGR